MIQYIIKRILYFIPTIFIISLVIFFLSKATPGDPLGDLIQLQDSYNFSNPEQAKKEVCRKYKELNLDKPNFYFSISPRALHPDIKKECDFIKRKWFRKLSLTYGSYENVLALDQRIKKLFFSIADLHDSITAKNELKRICNNLSFESANSKIEYYLTELEKIVQRENVDLHSAVNELKQSYLFIKTNQSRLNRWVPVVQWNGVDNQYHRWISDALRLDFGNSLKDNLSVFVKIADALKWTLLMVVMSFILTLIVGIPTGVYLASVKNSSKDRVISLLLYLFYAIPIFWLATLLIVFFTTDEYGSWTNIFPSIMPVLYEQSDPFMVKLLVSAKFLILPVICIAIHSTAYISRLTRSSVIDQLGLPYNMTAKSKGLSQKSIVWKHSFKNAMIPMVSLLIAAIPASFAGSLVIEVIFNIPGMGRLIYDSVFGNDWPILFGTVLFIGSITILIYLIGDICYRLVNPKISFS